jgi:hypothetical protein
MEASENLKLSATELLSRRDALARLVEEVAGFLIKKHEENTSVTHEEILQLFHLNIKLDRQRYYFSKARLQAEKEGFFFETINGSGFKPLPQGKAVKSFSQGARKRITSSVNCWGDRLKAIDPTQLNQTELTAFLTESVSHLRHQEAASATTYQKIEVEAEAIAAKGLDSKNIMKLTAAAYAQLEKVG